MAGPIDTKVISGVTNNWEGEGCLGSVLVACE